MIKKNIYFFILFFLSLLLISGNHESRLVKANFLSKTFFFPFISSVNAIEQVFKVKRINEELKKDLAQKNIELNQLLIELNRAKIGISEYFDSQSYDFIIAEVIGTVGDHHERKQVLNKGYIHGVRESYPIITNEGVVGKVINVFQNYSIILPVNHHMFKLSVSNKNTGTHGLLETDFLGNTYMSMIRPGSRMNIGDTITTSNVSRIFPKGYSVGTVRRLEASPEQLYIRALIDLFVNVVDLEYVFILIYDKEIEYDF